MLTTFGDSRGGAAGESVKVASSGPYDRIQKALQVIGAVEGDPDDSPFVTEHLHLDIGLESLANLVLHTL
jgi:predicted nucleic acid-binding protein